MKGRPRDGFSMLEVVIALAVLSLGAALVTTRASAALDQIATHAAFQDFQTALIRLRADAFAADAPLELTAERVALRPGWSFRAAAPIVADGTGSCSGEAVELVRGDKVRARLIAADRSCRYLRAS